MSNVITIWNLRLKHKYNTPYNILLYNILLCVILFYILGINYDSRMLVNNNKCGQTELRQYILYMHIHLLEISAL